MTILGPTAGRISRFPLNPYPIPLFWQLAIHRTGVGWNGQHKTFEKPRIKTSSSACLASRTIFRTPSVSLLRASLGRRTVWCLAGNGGLDPYSSQSPIIVSIIRSIPHSLLSTRQRKHFMNPTMDTAQQSARKLAGTPAASFFCSHSPGRFRKLCRGT